VHDGPVLLRLAPQGEDDGTPAKHLVLALSRERIFQLDVTKKELRFGHEIMDHFVTVAARGRNNHLRELTSGGGVHRVLQLGNDERNLPFFLHREIGLFLWRCLILWRWVVPDGDWLSFLEVASRRRTCSANQEKRNEKNLRCPAYEERFHKVPGAALTG
jgi:hypothetical protein